MQIEKQHKCKLLLCLIRFDRQLHFQNQLYALSPRRRAPGQET